MCTPVHIMTMHNKPQLDTTAGRLNAAVRDHSHSPAIDARALAAQPQCAATLLVRALPGVTL
jgi:hypothetical protein